MEELLRFVCEGLEKRDISYMLSGSLALNAYSRPRMTRDIDLVVELRTENFDRFAGIFATRDCYFHQESAKLEIVRRGMFNVIDWASGMKIDFILQKDDLFQQTEFQRRVRIPVFPAFECWVISPEDLILAKLMWIQQVFSEQQLIDVRSVIRDYPALDRTYITGWIDQLRLNDFNLFAP
ncbi:MAG: nucleotidyl transferase AbiEii/AbiGii toxin family protein [Bacteroidetes bacterium]|nr:nucleotidyl transferase AbiEii/AbiGii toxin family protein [Fibrella sp.]